MSRHPTSAELAALVSGHAAPGEARAIREHLARCPACREAAGEAALFLSLEAKRPSTSSGLRGAARRRRPPPWAWMALAATLALALGAAWWQARPSGVQELFAAAGDERPGPARLAGAPFRPEAPVVRGDEERPGWRLLAAAERARQAALDDPGPQTFHALGVAHLLLGERDEAIEVLEQAHRADPADPAILTDLAAARIDRAHATGSGRDWAVAADLLSGPAPRTTAMAFDRALALTELGLLGPAEAAWAEAVDLERSGPWRDEAARRRAELARIHREAPTAREIETAIYDDLARWAETVGTPRQAEADSALAAARRLAAAYRERHGDPLPLATVAAVEGATDRERDRLAADLLTFRAMREAYAGERPSTCLETFADSGVEGGPFAPVHAPLLLRAAACAYLTGDLDRSAGLAAAAASRLEELGITSPAIAGDALWMEALIGHSRNEPAAAVRGYEAALEIFRASHDDDRRGAVIARLADLAASLGRRDRAWELLREGLGLPNVPPREQFQLLHTLVDLAGDEGLGELAAVAADALFLEAQEAGGPTLIVESGRLAGRALLAAGRRDEAVAALEATLDAARGIPDQALRERHTAFVALDLASAVVGEDPRRAHDLLQLTGDYAVPSGAFAVARAGTEFLVARRLGDPDAERFLERFEQLAAGERAQIASLAERDQLFEQRRELHEALVSALVEDGRSRDALALVRSWRGVGPEGDGGDTLQTASQTLRITYLSLPAEILRWEEDGSQLRLVRVPVPRPELARTIARANEELRRGDLAYAATPPLLRLADLLLPVPVPAGARLLLGPDATVASVPFAALPVGGDREPLIDRATVVIATGGRTPRQGPSSERRCALLLTGAADGGDLYPELRRLPDLEEEAREVARLYPCSFTASDPTSWRSQISEADVIHFAGHAVGEPGASQFLLFRTSEGLRTLGADEIAELPLDGQTFVLGACSTATGRPSALAASDGLPRAFLAAGAGSVIATLWPIDDEAAREVARRLHPRLAAGEGAAEALAAVQRELISEEAPAGWWGGWEAVER